MAYQALYRQWRPRTFSAMVGQQPIITTLKNQVVSGRIAHAYLFCGSRGTGKTSTAKILAKAINCEHPKDGDPCNECVHCLQADREESLDIIEIDAASNNGVDEIRDLRDTVKYPPQSGKYKVYIIDEVHMLSTSAFNALLKTLEEPPAYVVFILATTEPQKLPETILSRCQRFDFGRLALGDIQNRLDEAVRKAGAEADPGALMMIARAAEGGMRDAFSILDMCLGAGKKVDEPLVRSILGTSDRSFLFRFAGALLEGEAGEALAMISELFQSGRDPAVFSKEMSGHFRLLVIAKTCGEQAQASLQELTPEDYGEYLRQSEGATVTRLMKIMEHFMNLETELRYFSSPRFALENTALKCMIKTGDADPQSLMDRIAELEKRIGELAAGGVQKAEKSSDFVRKDSSTAAQSPAQATPAASSVDPADLRAVESALLEVLKRKEPGLPGILKQGHIYRFEGDTLFWAPKAGPAASAFVKSLNMEARKKIIAEVLKEITGKPVSFQATDPPEGGKDSREEQNDQKYIQNLVSTFGEGPVQVVEES